MIGHFTAKIKFYTLMTAGLSGTLHESEFYYAVIPFCF